MANKTKQRRYFDFGLLLILNGIGASAIAKANYEVVPSFRGSTMLATDAKENLTLVSQVQGDSKLVLSFSPSQVIQSEISLKNGNRSLTRLQVDSRSTRLRYSSFADGKETTYLFRRSPQRDRFVLYEIRQGHLAGLYLKSGSRVTESVDSQNFCPVENAAAQSTQIANLLGSASLINSKAISETCSPHVPDLIESLQAILKDSDSRYRKDLVCINRVPEYANVAALASSWIAQPARDSFTCSARDKSHFDRIGTIVLGAEIYNEKNPALREANIFHEVLHAGGIDGETEVNDAVTCCSADGDLDSCRDMTLWNVAPKLKSYPGIEDLLAKIIHSGASFEDRKSALIQANKILDDFWNSVGMKTEAEIPSINKLLSKVCADVTKANCDSSYDKLASLSREQFNFIKDSYFAIRKFSSESSQGAAPAQAGGTGGTPGPIIPQKLTYKPGDEQSIKAVEATVQRYQAPMAAAATYAGTIGNTFVASMGSSASAAVSSLPRRVSDNEYATDVVGVNQQTGVTTLDLGTNAQGQHLTGEAWIPFHGSQFDPPHVEIHDAQTGQLVASSGARPSDSGGGSSGSTIPGRILKPGQQSRSGSANLASAGDTGSSGSLGGAPGGTIASGNSSGGSRAATSAPSNPSNGSTAFLPEPTFKRILFRTPYTDRQALRSLATQHKKEFQTYSLSFIYCHDSYPSGFVGKTQVNLDANNPDDARNCEPLK